MKLRRHSIFILILAFAAISRIVLLCQSQTHVHSDEAIIGLMGKHISEGRYFPFYMYGQSYNAGAAWEAYIAAIPFAIFGANVILLKACVVALSLVCLVLFYRLAHSMYGQRTAELAALIFALSPSLLKWHFQVRGYSFYFLSIPVLTSLFLSIESASLPKARKVFFLGLACGLSLWGLELILPLMGALWILLALRRKLSNRNAAIGMAGFMIGYSPAILFNLTHHFSNWHDVFVHKTVEGGILGTLFDPSACAGIFGQEMPKFFGPDTILWYYSEIPASGIALYAVALLSVAAAVLPFFRQPSKIRRALCAGLSGDDENKDLLLLVFTAACFVPYLDAQTRVASYFLGGCFFLSLLTARLLQRCFNAPQRTIRVLGGVLLLVILFTSVVTLVETGRRNQIETLTLDQTGNAFLLARIPGADIEAVEQHLRQRRISAVWATVSFVYPLIFESNETLVASDAIFGWEHQVYPSAIPWRVPKVDSCGVFVIETHSPLRPSMEKRCAQNTGVPPHVTEYGTLTVIEQMQR